MKCLIFYYRFPSYTNDDVLSTFSGKVIPGKPYPPCFTNMVKEMLKQSKKPSNRVTKIVEIDFKSIRKTFDSIRAEEQTIALMIVNVEEIYDRQFYESILRQFISVNILNDGANDMKAVFLIDPNKLTDWINYTVLIKDVIIQTSLHHSDIVFTEKEGRSFFGISASYLKPQQQFASKSGDITLGIVLDDIPPKGLLVHMFKNNAESISKMLGSVKNDIVLVDKNENDTAIQLHLVKDDIVLDSDGDNEENTSILDRANESFND